MNRALLLFGLDFKRLKHQRQNLRLGMRVHDTLADVQTESLNIHCSFGEKVSDFKAHLILGELLYCSSEHVMKPGAFCWYFIYRVLELTCIRFSHDSSTLL